jgi:alkyl sulfatase BDS1-like metallo-beta-lactamase superfamily hydrolase
MTDLLELSARVIDDGAEVDVGLVNRITLELAALGDRVAMVESFSHVLAFDSGDGLVLFDASLADLAPAVLNALRGWSSEPVHTLVYTHGHVDHVGGAAAILAEAGSRGNRRPEVVAHEAVPRRFRRYDLTNGYNAIINQRQFRNAGLVGELDGRPAFMSRWIEPSLTYRDHIDLHVGDLDIELHHGRGETDDHTWAWIPAHRAACVGDFVIWAFPNAGNPQKVQRYPLEWARVLRQIAARRPALLLPAHGLPVSGEQRVARLLDDTATALESLVEQTLDLMNDGCTLDTIIHTVEVPADLIGRPYLRPTYDDPEFIVRNVWRLYGGWYDGNPARLKPAPDRAVAAEVAALAGGVTPLVTRARELAGSGDLRLACQLVEWAVDAEPDDREVLQARADIYRLRRKHESSLMAKGIFGAAARQSSEKLEG